MGYVVAILCVLGVGVGQLLLRLGTEFAERDGGYLTPSVLLTLGGVIGLYGLLFLAWFWVVGNIGLARAYPMMALSFVLVPFGGYLFFGERFGVQYLVGLGLVVAGILLIIYGSSAYR
jgi:drug/metabolite transporter (DMT)-like permease